MSGISQSKTSASHAEPTIDWSVFVPTFIMVALLGGALIGFQDASNQWVADAVSFIKTNLSWLYLLIGLGALFFCGWLAFGPYGGMKLGADDEQPEFTTPHWVAMMFTAGIGAGLIVWGFAEPIYYIQTPPFGITPHSDLAFEWAHVYPLFHWGVIPWAVYAVPAIPIAYLLYRRRESHLRISHTLSDSFPGAKHPAIASFIDILIMLGILGGTATSLGLGVPLVSSFLSALTGMEDSVTLKFIVLFGYTLIFGASAYRGLKKGIKVLADINMVLAIIMMLFILLIGPTVFILSLSVNSLGMFFDNFWRMSLWTDPITQSGFPEDWTVFYWAWWIAFAAFIGLFFGRISRGRTIRQVVLGIIGLGSLGTTFFLLIAGGYSLHLEQSGALAVSEVLSEHGLSYTVTAVLSQLPFGKLTLLAFFILALIFYATTLDSAAYVLASVSSKDLRNDQEPPRANRLIWAFALAFFTAGLIKAGSLSIVQSMTIVFSLPIIPILVLMSLSLVKWLRADPYRQ
ncbi:MAG: BCCT family transporter [Pseudomonadota bacterium]